MIEPKICAYIVSRLCELLDACTRIRGSLRDLDIIELRDLLVYTAYVVEALESINIDVESIGQKLQELQSELSLFRNVKNSIKSMGNEELLQYIERYRAICSKVEETYRYYDKLCREVLIEWREKEIDEMKRMNWI